MYADPAFFDEPDWRGDPRRRLQVALLLGAGLLMLLAAQLRLPSVMPGIVTPELDVRIDAVEEVVADEPVSSAPLERVAEPASTGVAVDAAEPVTPTAPPVSKLDMEQLILDAVAAEADMPEYSVNPAFERKREAAAEQFAPLARREDKPVWENVEKDQTGRTILRSGDCYRVINDPNVGSREMFEIFGQYLTICGNYKRKPQALPWVDEVNARRARPTEAARPTVE